MRTLDESLLQTLKLRFDGWAVPITGDPLRQPGHRRSMYEVDTMRRNADTPPPADRKWVHISD